MGREVQVPDSWRRWREGTGRWWEGERIEGCEWKLLEKAAPSPADSVLTKPLCHPQLLLGFRTLLTPPNCLQLPHKDSPALSPIHPNTILSSTQPDLTEAQPRCAPTHSETPTTFWLKSPISSLAQGLWYSASNQPTRFVPPPRYCFRHPRLQLQAQNMTHCIPNEPCSSHSSFPSPKTPLSSLRLPTNICRAPTRNQVQCWLVTSGFSFNT